MNVLKVQTTVLRTALIQMEVTPAPVAPAIA